MSNLDDYLARKRVADPDFDEQMALADIVHERDVRIAELEAKLGGTQIALFQLMDRVDPSSPLWPVLSDVTMIPESFVGVNQDYQAKYDDAQLRIADLEAENTRLREEAARWQWISVEERLPERSTVDRWHTVNVLVCRGFGRQNVAYYDYHDRAWHATHKIFNVTHWMELPEPPKEGK
jgi:hypothetical protein